MTGRGAVAEWVRTRDVPSLTKLVLLLIFDRVGEQEDGRWCAWPSLQTIASEAGIASIATIRKHLATLEAAEIISREARHTSSGRQTSNRIVLLFPPTRSTGSGDTTPPEAGHPLSTERGTTLNPQNEASEEATRTARVRAVETVSYRGRAVKGDVVRAAIEAVEEWARRTEQTVRTFDAQGKATESLRRVIGAMLSYPEVVELWPKMIDAALSDPWWRDARPGVGVVFGPNVVERMIAAAKGEGGAGVAATAPRRGGGPTAQDFAALALGE